MRKDTLADAVAGIVSQIAAALLAGHSTAELRAEMSQLEERQRREVAATAAAERDDRPPSGGPRRMLVSRWRGRQRSG